MGAKDHLFELSWFCRAVGARSIPAEPLMFRTNVSGVSIDSRTTKAGDVFFALKGEQTDGHRFVGDALRRGAVAAVISHTNDTPAISQSDGTYLVVDDVLRALQTAASRYREQLGLVDRIGITGSNGKTTTKEMLGAILAGHDSTYVSSGNLNSETGVPLSVFSAPSRSRFAVFEMAMSNPGEMPVLARIVKPTIAVITNIGTAHIGQLGSKQAIAQEKKAIAGEFAGSETLFVPDNDDFTPYLSDGIRGRVELFGPDCQNAEFDLSEETTTVACDGGRFRVPYPGFHNALNALAAVRVAQYLGVPFSEIRDGIESTELPFGRSRIIHGARTVVVDHYNANPESMQEALLVTARIARSSSATGLVFVLGAMKELGTHTEAEHRRLVERAVSYNPDVLAVVGPEFSSVRSNTAIADQIHFFQTTDEAFQRIGSYLRPGQVVLLKGSRSIQLERLEEVVAGRETVSDVEHRNSGAWNA